jgi:hypothetical protein
MSIRGMLVLEHGVEFGREVVVGNRFRSSDTEKYD